MYWPAMISFILIVGISALIVVGIFCWFHHFTRQIQPLPTPVQATMQPSGHSIIVAFQRIIQRLTNRNRQEFSLRQTPGSQRTCNSPMPTVEVTVDISVTPEPLPEIGIMQAMTSLFPPSDPIPESLSALPESLSSLPESLSALPKSLSEFP